MELLKTLTKKMLVLLMGHHERRFKVWLNDRIRMKKQIIIVGGAPELVEKDSSDFIVAVNSGIINCVNQNIKIDLAIIDEEVLTNNDKIYRTKTKDALNKIKCEIVVVNSDHFSISDLWKRRQSKDFYISRSLRACLARKYAGIVGIDLRSEMKVSTGVLATAIVSNFADKVKLVGFSLIRSALQAERLHEFSETMNDKSRPHYHIDAAVIFSIVARHSNLHFQCKKLSSII